MENRQNPVYRDAFKHGGDRIISRAARLCRDIGNPVNDRYGPKYRLMLGEAENIEIYVDDYGNYSYIRFNGSEVASNHYCDQYFIAGEWEDILNHALMTEPSFIGDGI